MFKRLMFLPVFFLLMVCNAHAVEKLDTTYLFRFVAGTMDFATSTYTGGNPQPTALESDLTSALAGFNDGKTEALTLGGSVVDTPTEAGVTAKITDWKTMEGEPTEAI